MYNVDKRYLLLEIPKNGSRSLVAACCDHHGKKWMKAQGHVTVKDFVTSQLPKFIEKGRWPDNPIPTYAIFRNPVERFHSQIKQAWRKRAAPDLDNIMKEAWMQSDIVFKPQAAFIELPTKGDWQIDLRFWDMKRINTAMEYIVGKPVSYRKNRDPGSFAPNMDQIMAHKLYDDIMEAHYKEDFKLWIRAQKTDDEGRER